MALLVLGREFQQPDRRSCGAAVAVIAEALSNDGYSRRLLAGGQEVFDSEVRAMHRRITGPIDVSGRMQAPWLRAIGTAPWALSRQLSRGPRGPRGHRVVPARVRPGGAWAATKAALAQGGLVPVYVGDRWSPRHVVLAVDQGEEAIRVYEPASGRTVQVDRAEWIDGRLRLAGWRVPWFVLSPLGPPTRRNRA